MKSIVGRVLQQFLKNTTLHGFKYITSPYYIDRKKIGSVFIFRAIPSVVWIAWCVISASCAGALVAVLYARFLDVPALLTLQVQEILQPMPTVGICLTPRTTAKIIAQRLTAHTSALLLSNNTKLAAFILQKLLEKENTSEQNLLIFEDLLESHNMTLSEAIIVHMPRCTELMFRCRLQDQILPCSQLFHKQLVAWAGACCVMPSKTGTKILTAASRSRIRLDNMLEVVLRNVHGTDRYDYKFFTQYLGEDASAVRTHSISRGHYHFGQLTFTSVRDKDVDRLDTGSCVSDHMYSRTQCRVSCRERACGCSDPLRTREQFQGHGPPTCTVLQMSCLSIFKLGHDKCNCKPACKFVSSVTALRALALRVATDTFDPLFAGMDYTASVVLNLQVKNSDSKTFNRMSTETWFSLLSSLGGVFSMFLGVGLFSALELLFFFIVRLPLSIRRSIKMDISVTTLHS